MQNLCNSVTQITLNAGENKLSVLIFVPGMAEIITKIANFNIVAAFRKKYTCIPVYSNILFNE